MGVEYKQFKLLGETIKVIYQDTVVDDGTPLYGQSVPSGNYIRIARKVGGYTQNNEQLQKTLWHEITHIMFTKLGYDKESNNEQMVELLSAALQQIVNTLK